jgi:hypothetical protein
MICGRSLLAVHLELDAAQNSCEDYNVKEMSLLGVLPLSDSSQLSLPFVHHPAPFDGIRPDFLVELPDPCLQSVGSNY